jgi:hypothetical protein
VLRVRRRAVIRSQRRCVADLCALSHHTPSKDYCPSSLACHFQSSSHIDWQIPIHRAQGSVASLLSRPMLSTMVAAPLRTSRTPSSDRLPCELATETTSDSCVDVGIPFHVVVSIRRSSIAVLMVLSLRPVPFLLRPLSALYGHWSKTPIFGKTRTLDPEWRPGRASAGRALIIRHPLSNI